MEVTGVLGYSGQDLGFISGDCFAFSSGNGLCIFDNSKGAKDVIWRNEKSIEKWAFHEVTNLLAIAPKIDGDDIHIISYLNLQTVCHLSNPSVAKIVDFCFSPEGTYLLAISDNTDHRVMMWNIMTQEVLFSVELPFKCQRCILHPVNYLKFAVYGTNGICECNVVEILKTWDVKFNPISLADESGAESYTGICSASWAPVNALIIGADTGSVVYYDTSNTNHMKLLTLPGRPSSPVKIVVTAENIIIASSSGVIYWYPDVGECMEGPHAGALVPLQIITLTDERESEGSTIGSLTTMVCNHDIHSLIAGTSDGMIYRFDVDMHEPPRQEDGENDEDKKEDSDRVITVELSIPPMYTLHSSVSIVSQVLSIPISERISATATAKTDGTINFDSADCVHLLVTGSAHGSVSFWKTTHTPDQSASAIPAKGGVSGLVKSIPNVPIRMGYLTVCEGIEEMAESSVEHAITSIEILSVGSYGGGKLIAVGTASGWVEVWRVEASCRDADLAEASEELNEDEDMADLKVSSKLLFRHRFYQSCVSVMAASDSQMCFAVASYFNHIVYVINCHPRSKFSEIKTYTLGEPSTHAVGMSWVGPLLWVYSEDAIFFTFLPELTHEFHDSDTTQEEENPPSLAELSPANPKAMWESEVTHIGQSFAFPGTGGGCIFTRRTDNMVCILDSFPTVFDLEGHNLLNKEKRSDEEAEVPMLPLPGKLRTSVPVNCGIVCLARSQANQLAATGTTDGSVFIWRARRTEISLLNRIQPHSAPVISVAFSADSSQLVSCAADGSIYITQVEKPCSSTVPTLGLFLENDIDTLRNSDVVQSKPTLHREQQKDMVMAQLKQSFESKSVHFQSLVDNIGGRLRTVLQKNADANELEKMDLDEFVIDLQRKQEIIDSNAEAVNKLREQYEIKNARNELIAARVRRDCWDTMDHHSVKLFPITSGGQYSSLSSFPVEKVTDQNREILERVKRLRAIEIHSQSATYNTKGGGCVDKTRSGNWRSSWGRNLHSSPYMISWLLNDGDRWPKDDVVKAIIEQERANAAAAASGEGSTSPTKGDNKDDAKKKGAKGESEPAPALAKSTSNVGSAAAPASAKTNGDDDDDISLTAELGDIDIDVKNVLNLLYPPQTVRTPVQKRSQILFLKEVLRVVKTNFNKHFEKIYREKEDVVAGIHAKNARISEIASELEVLDEGSGINPKWLNVELFDSAIQVADDEVKSRPFETEKMRQIRLAEEERKRREAANEDDDGKKRALEDMMNGTLEVKRDVLSDASALHRPEWMNDLPVELMSEAQKKEKEEFDERYAALLDERAKYKKSLEVEMKKLKVEANESQKIFDDKFTQMARLKILTQREILAQELYISRLALSMVKREQAWTLLKSTEASIETNRTRRSELSEKIDRLSNAVDDAKNLLQQLQDDEKVLDRSFKRDLQTLCNIVFDQDTLKLFSQLYKMRKYADSGQTSNHGDEESEMSTMGDPHSSRGGTKRRSSFKRSYGNSKGVSKGAGHLRKSKGSSMGNKQDALGPMQAAARAMQEEANEQKLLFNPKDSFYAVMVSQDKEKKIAESQLPLLQPLNIDIDCPEGFSIDPFVWQKLQELRLTRIAKEIEVRNQMKVYSEIKKKLDTLSADEDAILSEAMSLRSKRESILERLGELARDLDVVVSVKQGQDEVDSQGVVTDYSDAKLLPTSIIRKYNARINELGNEKIGVLLKIKQFRRKMNLVDWESQHLELEAWHMEEYYTDTQLFRVTRDLQRVIKDGSDVDRSKVGCIYLLNKLKEGLTSLLLQGRQDNIAIRKDFLKKDAETKIAKLTKAIEAIKAQISDREAENSKLQEKIGTLKGDVAVREQVVRHGTHGAADTGLSTSSLKATSKMKKVVARRKLVDTARVQAEEIDYLKQELDKLRQKTFPSFVRATHSRLVYNPDERV